MAWREERAKQKMTIIKNNNMASVVVAVVPCRRGSGRSGGCEVRTRVCRSKRDAKTPGEKQAVLSHGENYQ